MENQRNEKEREIDLAFLFKVLKKAIVLMIVAAMFFGAIGIAYSVAIEKPKYQGTVTFWVANNSPDANYTSQSLVYAAAAIASSCIELVKQDMPIREAVRNNGLVEKLGYESEDKCVAAVRSMISARKEDENSLMFYVTVQADTKDDAYDVAKAIEEVMPGILNKLCSISSESISMITATGGVNNPDSVRTVKSSPLTTAIILGFVAAVATYAVFFVLSIFDVSIYDESTVKANFTYPIIGNIPSFASGDEIAELKKNKYRKNPGGIVKRNYKNKLLAEDSPFFMTESFNTLRTNVIYAAAAAKNPIFAVTSDIAAVGKTVVASNLAIALSGLGKKVLLVECDMRCPTFSKLFKIKSEQGLSELLAAFKQANLITTEGDAEWKLSKSGKEALLGADKLKNRLNGEKAAFESAIESLDHKKNYLLSGSEEFLIKLGISDKTGHVHDKRQGKFRQINRFLEIIEDIYPELPCEGEIKVYDL